MKCIILLILIVGVNCEMMKKAVGSPDIIISSMKKPIIVSAISKDGAIVLVDSTSRVFTIDYSYYTAQALINSYKIGDTLR